MIWSIPDRRKELNAYLSPIADLHLKYGRFIFYHYQAITAALFSQSGFTLDWSILDTKFLMMLTQAVSCHLCGTVGHLSAFCRNYFFNPNCSVCKPAQPLSSTQHLHLHGRKVEVFNNAPICDNFNESVCSFPNYAFLHICNHYKDAHPIIRFTPPHTFQQKSLQLQVLIFH